MDDDAAWLEARLGWQCQDLALAAAALTHRSAGGSHNERLEFLGDAVLSLVVAELLYTERPRATEGELSRYRASLVNAETLADLAEELGLGERLRLGAGELRSGGFRRRSILADALEAIFGAALLDGGIDTARALIVRLLSPKLALLTEAPGPKDPKTRLQEWLQARGLPLPRYAIESITGEPHSQTFAVSCEVSGLSAVSEGTGASRRRAEQAAAKRALAALAAGGEPE
jgi:ribonuclease-3